MKLYDAAFDPVINRTADTLVNALVLVAAVVILVLRKRKKTKAQKKDEE